MNLVRLFPVFFSFLLIAAHFQRAGFSFFAVVSLLVPGLLYFTRPWSIRIIQTLMFLAAIEWVRTLIYLVQLRQEADQPWVRLAIIIGTVALFTGVSTLVFRHRSLKKKYNLA